MKKENRIALSRADRTFDTINYIILTIVLLLVAYPLYFIVIASVSDPVAVYAGKVRLWPVQFTLEGYRRILEYNAFFTGYRNTNPAGIGSSRKEGLYSAKSSKSVSNNRNRSAMVSPSCVI